MRLVVDDNAYNDIEDLTNTSDAWDLLEAYFKPRGSCFLNNSIEKVFFLFLADCKDASDYITQFRELINELKSFSSKLQLDEKILIFLFQNNLSDEHSG